MGDPETDPIPTTIVGDSTAPPPDPPAIAPETVSTPPASERAVEFSEAIIFPVGPAFQRFSCPSMTNRVARIANNSGYTAYINFGDSSVIANPGQGTPVYQGLQQFVIPDSVTHMALQCPGVSFSLLVSWGRQVPPV